MNKLKNKKKKKLTKSQIISRIMYIIAALAIITIIGASSDIFYDYYTDLGRQKGYNSQSLYDDFISKRYGDLIQKVDYNIGIGREVTPDDSDYYAFAKCYDSAMDYHMYQKTEQNDLATKALDTYRENESKIDRRIFKDAIQSVRETYQIP